MKISTAEKEFLQFAHLKLDDPEYLDSLQIRAMDTIAVYLSQPIEDILRRVQRKIAKGTMEHGNPFYPPEKIEEEIMLELDDFIFGWPIVEDFNTWMKNKSIQ